jgi:hypothetical protein
MKRLITLVAALAFVSVQLVAAQDKPATSPLDQHVSLDFQTGDIAQLIQKLCADQHANCSIAPEIKGTWTGSLSDVTLLRAIRVVASSRGYTATVEDGIVYVKAPVIAAVMSSEELRNQPLTPVELHPTAPLPPNEVLRNQPLPPPSSYSYRYASYNVGYYDPYERASELRINGAATTGWLKIYAQGDTDFAKYLVVLRRVGSTYVPACAGGKAFRALQHPCEVPVGLNTYRFELRKGGKTQFYEEDIEMFSKFDHEHPFQYPISQETFNSWQNAEGMKRVETWKTPTPPVPPTVPEKK